jgi:hypothetical protein
MEAAARIVRRRCKKSRGSSMKELSHADDHGVRVCCLAIAPRNRCLVQRDDPLSQSRRGFRRIELADQPARVDEELEGSGASAIRRALTRIPDELPVEPHTPDAIIGKLNEAINAGLADPK